jgi:tRNA threonylcarbamoyladenosine biosynthesis protein TsaB
VALLTDDGCVSERFQLAPQRHTQLLLPMVDELLADAGLTIGQLDGFAFGHGPGSFTGLRIALAVVQGLALGADRPVVGVSTLAAMALPVLTKDGRAGVAVAMDARMGEIYWGLYRAGADSLTVTAMADDSLCLPEGVGRLPAGDWQALGSGWRSQGDRLEAATGLVARDADVEARPHAADISRLALPELRAGRGVDPASAAPVYLRQKVAEKMPEFRSIEK